ncbi:MAG TPA: ABC transporter ATP-binding protein [Actinocrinis sp.]
MRSLPVPDPGVPDARSASRYLLWLLREQRRAVAGGMFFGIVWMVSQALLPAAAGRTIDTGIIARSSGELVRWSLIVLGLGLVKAVSGIMRHRNAMFNHLAASYSTVQVVTRKAVELGATLPKLVAAGDVVAVGTADISEIGSALDITARLSGAIASIVVVAIVMLAISPPLGLIVLVGVPLFSALTSLLLRPLHERQRQYRKLQGELTGRAVDIAAGLRVLRGIGGEGAFANRYRRESQNLRGATVSVTRVESGFAAAEVLMPGLITAGVTFLAARFALDRQLTVGQLVAFYGYATFLAVPLTTLMEAADLVTRGHVAAKRVVRILNLEREITDPEQAAAAPPAAGGALTDGESGLHAEPGTLLAVTCAEPEDADALAERLTRFAADGSPALMPVTIGGVPLAELPVAEVRSRILLARNSDALFSGTLREELDPSGAAGPDRIAAAIRTACAEDVVDALPDGLETEVTDGGRTFSGGQLQRLRLVRALLAGHEFTVFVEPTSAVDAHTEAAIAERLAELHAPTAGGDAHAPAARATVVFTTSPLMLDHAHQVAYMADGAVVATGTHHELLAAEPGYAAVVTRGESAQERETVSAETRTM